MAPDTRVPAVQGQACVSMLQQLMTPNRFISLASPDPDDSDTDIEPAEPTAPDNTVEDVSMDSDTEYFDALETEDDASVFPTRG